MIKKVKILESDCVPKFEKAITDYLKKGWSIYGNIVITDTRTAIMLVK